MKKFLIIFLFLTNYTYSQTGLIIYPFSEQAGVSLKREHSTFELRTNFLFTSAEEANLLMVEPELYYANSFVKKDKVEFKSGVGVGFGYITDNNNYWSVFIPLQIEIIPFDQCKQIFFIAEADLNRKQYPGFSDLALKTKVGIGFHFSVKE